MVKTVHVLNGDAILPIFKKSNIQGDVVIWREMLCDGPLDTIVASDEFWKKRYAFFEENFAVSKLEYFDKTIKELLKIDDLAEYDEIVMWFEFDLFCQVNLIALCSYLLQNYRKDVTYHLVCPGKVKGKERMQTLADFTSEDYKKLYENRLKISKNNLIFADESWKLYVENNAEKLKKFNFKKWSKFEYLQLAINEHLKRFPQENGLNEIENKIIKIVATEALTSAEIVKKLLFWQQENTVYGFGDLQYFTYLNMLKKYFVIKDEKYYLNTVGKNLINL
ncbi:DUF1835 domain-containing protein [Lutibacter sp.]|uniref:DUF1835 domain-containing protein n=1 Tax=Lutibacter sp. TaxID=1925666 RepID=UPI003563CC28